MSEDAVKQYRDYRDRWRYAGVTYPTKEEMMEGRRDVWLPRVDTHVMQEQNGSPWPTRIYVELWEVNGIGEKRFVDGQFYGPTETTSDPGAVTGAVKPAQDGENPA